MHTSAETTKTLKALDGRRVLVTGGAGFIGSHLVDALLGSKVEKIVVIDNFFLGTRENLGLAEQDGRVEIVRGDASDLSSLRATVEYSKIDLIFNLAVVPLPTSLLFPVYTFNTNCAITLNCCELLRLGIARKLVHISSSEIYGSASQIPMTEEHPSNPSTPYAASKEAGDQIVLSFHHTYGIDATIIRPFNNFGPRQNSREYAGIIPLVVRKIGEGAPVRIFGDGHQTRDYVFVKETVEYLIRLSVIEGLSGEVINVASGVETSVNQLVQRVKNLMGVPDHEVRHFASRPGDVRRHSGSSQKLIEVLGDSPSGLTDHLLLETISWYSEGTNLPSNLISFETG